MNDDELQARLKGADADLGRAAALGRVPRVADLERRHRRQWVRRGATLALFFGIAATAHLSRTQLDEPSVAPSLAMNRAASLLLDEHLASLHEAMADLRELRQRARPSADMESVSLRGFRALSSGFVRDHDIAKSEIKWIADRFSDTYGGQCAHAFLEGKSAAAVTSPATLDPLNER